MGGIKLEAVNYIGYYSEHEEKMKKEIMSQAVKAEERVAAVISEAMVDCRRDHLWQKLLLVGRGSSSTGKGSSSAGKADPTTQLNYHEFTELITLVHHETLDQVSF